VTFNPLDYPTITSYPKRTAQSAWTEHIPIAMLLIDLLRPSTFVELGTHHGTSYCAFCQAVKELALDCRCYAIDIWQGDEHTGAYGQDVLADFKAYHEPLYSTFSQLIQSTFDDACPRFADGSIDLLHIDGYHTYDAVRHDFDLWLPKMSDRGVVVLHDIAEQSSDFGAWKVWSEIEARYPCNFALYHGHGLGVVAVGADIPERAKEVFELRGKARSSFRTLMHELGRRIEERELALAYKRAEEETARLRTHVTEIEARYEEETARLRTHVTEIEARYEEETARLRTHVTEIEARYEEELAAISQRVTAAETARATLSKESSALKHHYEELLNTSRNYSNSLQAQLAGMSRQLEGANWQLSWFESSRGVRVVKLARASREVLRVKGPRSLAKHIALWLGGRRGYSLADISPRISAPAPALEFSADAHASRAVLFLSGCPGDSRRYRAYHQAEQLEMAGCTCEVATHGEVDLGGLVERFQYFVFHRVPYGPDIENFIEQAHQQGKPVIFDTDDLVFDPAAAIYVAALDDMDALERNLYIDGLVRYQKTLLKCDAVLVSTESLQREAMKLHKHVFFAPNVVSVEMLRGADSALAISSAYRRSSFDDSVVIGYFPGTRTHSKDFAEAAGPILWALETYPQVRVKIVGHLDLDERFSRFGDRVEYIPLQPWQHLPQIYTEVDINLAPLEPNNPFTDCKSCLKYLEASLLGIPTIASPTTDFVRVIEHGANGLLADTPEEWRDALRDLIESADLRREMGQRAYKHVRSDFTAPKRALRLSDTMNRIVQTVKPEAAERKLTINWILRAPIAERGGGYRAIFQQANHLGNQGHTVRVYVERIAHLEPMTDNQIRAFVAKHFGPLHVEVIVGLDHFAPADVIIATNWPTAYPVAKDTQSRFKFYYIQDFEPEFYDRTDSNYAGAERTYNLPLHHICLGANLAKRIHALTGKPTEYVDFALDDRIFRLTRPQEEREGPIKILFFARPGLKRRGYELGIEALRMVKRQRPEVEILLFGSSDEELGPMPFQATNLGVLTAEEVARAFNLAHIVLTYSLSNISYVPFEAMACGAAVVEADVPFVRDMVPPGETCLLLAEPEAHASAAALLRLIDDPALREQLSLNAARKMSKLTWKHATEQFEQILRRRCWVHPPELEGDVDRRSQPDVVDNLIAFETSEEALAPANGASMDVVH